MGAVTRTGRTLALLALPALALATVTFHRQWHWYMADVGRSATQLTDSGFIISGGLQVTSSTFGAVLARTNDLGETTSVRRILNLNRDGGYSCRLSDGGYAVLAESGGKILVRKYSPAGDSAWEYRSAWGGPISAFIPTFDGGCLVAGRIPDTAFDMGAIKLAADGREEWARHYDEPLVAETWARGACQTRDSGYVLCGDANDYISTNMRLVRLTPGGDTVWTRLYHGPVGPVLTDVREMPDTGFLAVGYEFDTLHNRSALYMLRVTPGGNTVWARSLAPGAAAQAAAMCATRDGGFAIAGRIDWGDSSRAWLVKTDARGDTAWTAVLPGSGREVGSDVEQAADGGYVVAGTSDSAAGSLLLIKTDSLGGVQVGLAEAPVMPDASRPPLEAYPNPATSTLTVHLSPDAERSSVRIFDSQGRQVRSAFALRRSEFRIVLGSMPAGVYLLRLDSDRGSATQKVVIE